LKKILITGGAGFIGSALAEKFIQDPKNFVVIVDNLSTGSLKKLPDTLKSNCCFIRCDVNNYNDISGVMQSFRFNYVFHYAAMVGVKRTQKYPSKVLNDLHGIENILNLCKNTGVKRVYYSSSSEVYGEPLELPQNEETTPLNSRIPYAIVKNAGEAFIKAFKKDFDLEYTIFRFFNTYGEKQSMDFVIPHFLNLAMNNHEIPIYGDGLQTRTFCYIDDNIDACYRSFKENLMVNDIANIGNDDQITILDLAKTIIKLTKSNSKIVHLPPLKEGDMRQRYPDVTKMKKLLKRDFISLEEGLAKIIRSLN